MTTKLHRVTLTFRIDGAIDAVFVRKGCYSRRYEIHARFGEYGWHQWNEPREILAENVCVMERIQTVLAEDHLS